MSITRIALLETGNGYIIAGAESRDYLKRILRGTEAQLTGVQVKGTVAVSEVPECSGYGRQLRNPLQSGNYHLQQGGSRWEQVSFIDWWTFLPERDRERMCSQLFEAVVDSQVLEQVEEKQDIGYVLEDALPYVGQHGVKTLIGRDVWTYLREHGLEGLSAYSQRAVENGERGQRFEQFFQDLCEKSGLRCWKRSASAFKQFQPDVYRQVWNEMGTMKGIPDFFVTKPNTHNLNTWMDEPRVREWEPEQRYGFVEVKYNESTLSPGQREMIRCLIEHGQEVWVLNGDREQYRFEEVSW